MRKLRLVVRTTRGALPVLALAGLVPAQACGAKSDLAEPASARGGSDGSTAGAGGGGGAGGSFGGSGGSGGSGGIIIVDAAVGGFAGTGGGNDCPNFAMEETYVVELPAEGVPAEPGQICSSPPVPVVSNRAARMTLSGFALGAQTADGFLEIDPDLEASVLGAPTIQIIDASHPSLLDFSVSALTKVPGGFSFQASWNSAPPVDYDGFSRMTAMIELELSCPPPAASRLVHAAHDLHLCLGDGDGEWVSSGDQCVVCKIIAEMAPSPIVPDRLSDGLPLAQALRLRIVELCRVASAVVLFAENDGGPELEYEWHPSCGRIEQLAPDIVAWVLEPGMDAPFMQVAVCGEAGAAVASFAWNEAV
jgi:hypothetical protein